MRGLETARRAAIWGFAAAYLVLAVIMGFADQAWLLAWAGYPVTGAVILTARRGNRIGRLLIVPGLLWFLSGLLFYPVVLAATPAWAESLIGAATPLAWAVLPILVVLYPDGRLETVLGRVVAVWIAVGAGTTVIATLLAQAPLEYSHRANPLAVPALAPVTAFLGSDRTFLVVPVIMLAAVVDLVLRWRRADAVRRLQFRWLTYGASVTVGMLIITNTLPAAPTGVQYALVLAFNAIPVTIMIAVTRHGLFEINRVISRTVSYIAVTAIAVGVYALVVTSVTLLIPNAPSIAVATATLVAAALFLPVLRWAQRLVDRRFDRERYDAQKVVDAFGERLRAEVDPGATTPDLVLAVDRALQPTAVGVWTRTRS